MARDWVQDTFLVEAVLPAYALYCLLGLHTLMKQAAVLERNLWAETGGSWSSACIRLAKKGRQFMAGSQRPGVEVTYVTAAHILLSGRQSRGPTCLQRRLGDVALPCAQEEEETYLWNS